MSCDNLRFGLKLLNSSPRERWYLSGNTLDCRLRGCGFESHPRQKLNFCRAFAFRFYSAHSVKWVPACCGRGPPHSWDLKYGSIAFADCMWSVIVPALGLKTIPDLLDTNSTHGHRICPPHRTTLLWLHGLWTICMARCNKQHKSSVITLARIHKVLNPREVK